MLGLFMKCCRGGGIRTPGTDKGSPVFKTGLVSHLSTPLKFLGGPRENRTPNSKVTV